MLWAIFSLLIFCLGGAVNEVLKYYGQLSLAEEQRYQEWVRQGSRGVFKKSKELNQHAGENH